MNQQLLKGIVFVAVGASSYGILATFVRLANIEGYSTAEVTIAQAVLGFFGLLLFQLLFPGKKEANTPTTSTPGKDAWKLVLAGTSLGLTSTFYYLSVRYISVSICIILLMQAIWMGVVLECILTRTLPGRTKVIATLAILVGTLLSTNLLSSDIQLDWRGIVFGLLAALSYTVSIYSSNRIAPHFSSGKRSLLLMTGCVTIVLLIWGNALLHNFDVSVFWKWGIVLSVFGTIIPPLLFTRGMPITGVGLGSIIASIEIPVSVCCAHFLLNETVNGLQWLGIAIILASIVLMHLSLSGKKKANRN